MSGKEVVKKDGQALSGSLDAGSLFRAGAFSGGLLYNLRMQRQLSWEFVQMVRELKEQRLYLNYSETWEEFCPKYLGSSYKTFDRKLELVAAYGKDYFDVADMVRITPGVFEALNVKDGHIHLGREKIAIDKANEAQINEVVRRLKSELARKTEEAETATSKLEAQGEQLKNTKKAVEKAKQALVDRDRAAEMLWKNADEDHRFILDMQQRLDLLMVQLRTIGKKQLSADNQDRLIAFSEYAWAQIHQTAELVKAEYGVGLNAPRPSEWLDVDAMTPNKRDLVGEYNTDNLKA